MSASKIRVEVLRAGNIVREGSMISDASSSVTLIRAESKNLLVDTGSPRVREKLVAALKAEKLNPGDIDIVINTHLHLDHCGCNDMFVNARFIAHVFESPPIHYNRISGDATLFPGVAIHQTPGHSPGSISVFVTAERKYAVCGDALPTKGNFEQHVPPFINTDSKLALKSMDFIVSWADVVIPGHDAQFDVIGKK